jgi:CheY-like chemotaxis protein
MTSKKTVLFAEDNADDAELMALALAQAGFPHRVVSAEDGQEALDYLFARGRHAGRDRAEIPALVVLDVKMPRVSGLEVLEAMREEPALRDVPVAILTTSDEPSDRAIAEELGASLYLKKPMSFDELLLIVGRLRALIEP